MSVKTITLDEVWDLHQRGLVLLDSIGVYHTFDSDVTKTAELVAQGWDPEAAARTATAISRWRLRRERNRLTVAVAQ